MSQVNTRIAQISMLRYNGQMKTRINRIIVGDIATNCWLYPLHEETEGGRLCIVIDPGDEAMLIIQKLKELNWVPHSFFLTHGHFDHLAALPDLISSFEKGVFKGSPKTGIHSLDAHYIGKNAIDAHHISMTAAGGDPSYVDALYKPMPEADILFEEGDTAGPFKVLHVPGHTPGSVSFYDEKEGVLFSGDTLFRGDYGRTDLPGGSEDEIRKSLKRLLYLPEETLVCPGHGAAVTIGENINLFS